MSTLLAFLILNFLKRCFSIIKQIAILVRLLPKTHCVHCGMPLSCVRPSVRPSLWTSLQFWLPFFWGSYPASKCKPSALISSLTWASFIWVEACARLIIIISYGRIQEEYYGQAKTQETPTRPDQTFQSHSYNNNNNNTDNNDGSMHSNSTGVNITKDYVE